MAKDIVEESKASAKAAGLVYVSDNKPGIRRVRRGKSFSYKLPNGKPVNDPDTLLRIRGLAIPPAWEDVWICEKSNGHLQATGRDAKGRKQSRYHPDFRSVRDEAKYDKVLAFAAALPKLRRTVAKHIELPGLPREKVLAAIVRLLERTLIRIGNDSYANDNHSYGLTTIRNKHAKVSGSTIHFNFVGKSGVPHQIDVEAPKCARIIRKCQELPEQELFEYIDNDGTRRDVKSDDVNAYLKEVTGQDFTAKDFRTWAGTVMAAEALKEFEKFDSQAQAKKNIVKAIERVAARLGNTKAVCRKCYVHPTILNSYMDGNLAEQLQGRAERELKHVGRLPAQEAAVVALLQRSLRKQSKAARSRRKIAR